MTIPEAFDMRIDAEDRLYVATEIGVQMIRSWGLIDVILNNPTSEHIEELEIGEDGYLYALVSGKVYKRKLENKHRIKYDIQTQPNYIWYYD